MVSLLESARKNKSTWRPDWNKKNLNRPKEDWFDLSRKEFCEKYKFDEKRFDKLVEDKVKEFSGLLSEEGAEKIIMRDIQYE